jgi:hypothetical protein
MGSAANGDLTSGAGAKAHPITHVAPFLMVPVPSFAM